MQLDHQQRSEASKQAKIPILEVGGKIIPTDDQGYLLDFNDWSPAVTEAWATQDGIELDDDHWTLIDFLHRFYKEFEIAPEMPILSRNLCKDQQNCRWSRTYIKQLFPNGAKTACRYAGLPAPVGRSCL
ncbi:MAG: TusE/DsrC/DsvC family sulfur relay protein [Gammaproteobacteria bacterium]|nr:TusE/DsrC/DsvC family sulfur relay protein [Gammaproteobacteria bacterium]